MKAVSQAIAEYLNTHNNFHCCDLYQIVLSNGSTYYIADYDEDVTTGGRTWQHKMIVQRGQVKTIGEPNVDSMQVTISCDRNDVFGNVPFLQACHNGMLSGGILTLYRAFFSEGQCIGHYAVFSGKTEVTGAGGLKAQLNVKAETQGLSQQVPLRIFAPQNAYVKNASGNIVVNENDTITMLVPLKPSNNVLVRLNG